MILSQQPASDFSADLQSGTCETHRSKKLKFKAKV